MAMRGWKRWLAGMAGAAAVAASCLVAAAVEDPVLTTAYGTGVHAYYAGDYQRSYDDLTAAIDGGSNDPRAFYFRGLAALKLGRLDEADADFATGATREAAALGNWNVPRSLERIQGEDRLRLERHRARARVALMQRRREAIVKRYTEVDAAQETVLRRRRPEPVPAREAAPEDDKAMEEAEKLPEPEAADSGEEPAAEEEAAPEEADSPFGDEPANGNAEQPTAEESEEPAEETAEDEGDVLGDEEPAEDEADEEMPE